MSITCNIDPKTLQIVQTAYATESYRFPTGITIKPKTDAEMRRLERISENSKRLEKIRQEIAELDSQIDSHLPTADELRRRRRALAEDVQRQENFSNAVMRIHRLQHRAAELETIILSIPTSAGNEEMTIRMDDYTGNRHSMLSRQLDDLSEAFMSDEPEHVKRTMQTLTQLEEALEALPGQAYQTNMLYLLRMELAAGVANALHSSGWAVQVEDRGSVAVPARMTLTNLTGVRASVYFLTDGQIRLETPGFTESSREALRSRIISTLKACGAVDTQWKCLDQQQKGPALQDTAAAKHRQEEKLEVHA